MVDEDLTHLLAGMQLDESERTEEAQRWVYLSIFNEKKMILRHIARHNLRSLIMKQKKLN